MSTALLIANGQISHIEMERIQSHQFRYIVAADGGAGLALNWGLKPDYVVGDLDSITETIRNELPDAGFVRRPSQELNDLEKALQFCHELSVEEITLLGITGKRVDHTLSNFSVLSRYDQIFKFSIYDPYSEIFLVRELFSYQGKPGQLISLMPMGTVEGITTRGLAFSLENESLSFGVREGLSNFIRENPVEVKVKTGLLLVFAIYP